MKTTLGSTNRAPLFRAPQSSSRRPMPKRNREPDDIASWRKARIHALSVLARDTASLGGNMRRGTPGLDALLKASDRQLPSVKLLAAQVNIAFVAVTIDALQYPDTLLPWLLASGRSVVGDITAEASRVYRPDEPIEPIAEFQERWRAFAGQTMPKLRCCDDARSSGSNDHTRMAETVFYPSFEFPARVGAAVFDCCQQSGRSCPRLVVFSSSSELALCVPRGQEDADSSLRDARYSVRGSHLRGSAARQARAVLLRFDDSDVGSRARYRAQRRHVRHGQRSAFGVRSPAVPAVVRVGAF